MARYIDRDEAINHIETHTPYRCSNDFVDGQKDCINQLKALPTADVVEVVRCKDCGMSRETEDERYLFCMQFADTVDFQAFCSYGERKCDNG